MKFKSKVVEIEACQITQWRTVKKWAEDNGVIRHVNPIPSDGLTIICQTLQGPSRAKRGDWLIIGPNRDEVYPCSESVFNQKYECV